MLSLGGRRAPHEEPKEREIEGIERCIARFLARNVFTKEDMKFLLTEIAHGRGPPSFDYVGIERTNNQKALLDVKSCSKTQNYVFSSNAQEVITEAKALDFNVYVALITYLPNWNVRIELIPC